MNITSNTPRPQQPHGQRGSRLSWLIFLLILARPLWGIIRSMVGPQVTNQQIWLVIGGIVLAGVVVTLLTRGASRVSSRKDESYPVPVPQVRDFRRSVERAQTWTPPQGGSYQNQTPRFEPMITRNVVLAGLLLAAAIGGALGLIWVSSLVPS